MNTSDTEGVTVGKKPISGQIVGFDWNTSPEEPNERFDDCCFVEIALRRDQVRGFVLGGFVTVAAAESPAQSVFDLKDSGTSGFQGGQP